MCDKLNELAVCQCDHRWIHNGASSDMLNFSAQSGQIGPLNSTKTSNHWNAMATY